MPSTRSQKREKDDPSVEEVKNEPKLKKKKTKEAAAKDEEKVETAPEKKGKKKTAKIEPGKEETVGGPVTKIVKITVEACTS